MTKINKNRSREEIRAEREARWNKTWDEIRKIAAEYHAKLPRDRAGVIGACYGRFSSRDQDSIDDQMRELFEAAYREGIFIPLENIYFDMAVRGWKKQRPGLDALSEAAAAKAFDVFLCFTTSRLFRKTYRSMQFVEEQLVERGIRAIFIKSGLDTADGKRWKLLLHVHSMMDEASISIGGEHVRTAHEGLFKAGFICTSIPVGYAGEAVEGRRTKRKLPRRKPIIDLDTAPWVVRIFTMYVVDDLTLDQIARELNASEAPVPMKSIIGLWTRELVRSHLKNPKYRGEWSYGVKECSWSNLKDRSVQAPREEPLITLQLEHLRIVSDQLWYGAQDLLAKDSAESGRKGTNGRQRPECLLRGLFRCAEHGCRLVAGGENGSILHCKPCRSVKDHERPLFTLLNRKLALRLTCKVLGDLVRADERLVRAIISACQAEADRAQQPDPERIKRLKADVSKIMEVIRFNRNNPGMDEDEQQETRTLIAEQQHKLHATQAELAALEDAKNHPIKVPSESEVVALLDELGGILENAAAASDEAQRRKGRRIIDEITGGKIELYQQGERRKGRGWLQGRFKVDLVGIFGRKLSGALMDTDADPLEISIDYRERSKIDVQADLAMQYWNEGLLNRAIAARMGCSCSRVSLLIKYWHESRGLEVPNGYKRRAKIQKQKPNTAVYKERAKEVMDLVETGHSNLEVARRLGISDATVQKAIAYWHKSRGLSVPSAVDRRDQRLLRAMEMLKGGALLKDVASLLGYSSRGLKLALKQYCEQRGESLPDGRTRRRKPNQNDKGGFDKDN